MEVNPHFTFQAVAFDLDGTLIDSHVAMMRSYERWTLEYDLDIAEIPGWLGMPNIALAEHFVPHDAVAAARRIEHLETVDTDGVVALPGSRLAFDVLPRPRYGIGTSCTWDLLSARIKAAGLDMPDVAVSRDQVTHGKPSPDTYLEVAARLGVDPTDLIVFEDAPAGVQAARAAGSQVIGITSTMTAAELGADAHVPDLSHVQWHVDGPGLGLSISHPADAFAG